MDQLLRILLVEDDENLVELLQLAFEGEALQLDVARNGQEGITRAFESHPDLILMDIVMPLVNGYEAAYKIKSHAATRDIPIFFLTAKGMESDIECGKKAKGDLYLVKPFSPFELIALIRDYFSVHRPQISS